MHLQRLATMLPSTLRTLLGILTDNTTTVDLEIFNAYKFCRDYIATKMKRTKHFQQQICLNFYQWAPSTKIEHDRKLADKIFLILKFHDLWYVHKTLLELPTELHSSMGAHCIPVLWYQGRVPPWWYTFLTF